MPYLTLGQENEVYSMVCAMTNASYNNGTFWSTQAIFDEMRKRRLIKPALSPALAEAFKCGENYKDRKHMMRFVTRVERWSGDVDPFARYKCEHCGYNFNC